MRALITSEIMRSAILGNDLNLLVAGSTGAYTAEVIGEDARDVYSTFVWADEANKIEPKCRRANILVYTKLISTKCMHPTHNQQKRLKARKYIWASKKKRNHTKGGRFPTIFEINL